LIVSGFGLLQGNFSAPLFDPDAKKNVHCSEIDFFKTLEN
jgi:hypothetical protein